MKNTWLMVGLLLALAACGTRTYYHAIDETGQGCFDTCQAIKRVCVGHCQDTLHQAGFISALHCQQDCQGSGIERCLAGCSGLVRE